MDKKETRNKTSFEEECVYCHKKYPFNPVLAMIGQGLICPHCRKIQRPKLFDVK